MVKHEEMVTRQHGHLSAALDSIPELRGCGIGFVDRDNHQSVSIRSSNHGSRISTYVVIESVGAVNATPSSRSERRYWTTDRGHRLATESIGLVFDCGLLIASGVLTAGSTAATIATAGVSVPLICLSGGAAVASAFQCGVDIGRVLNVLFSDAPGGSQPNDMLDHGPAAEFKAFRRTVYAAELVGFLDGAHELASLSRLTARVPTGISRTMREPAMRTFFESVPAYDRAKLALETEKALGHTLTPSLLRRFVQGGLVKGMRSQEFEIALHNRLTRALSHVLIGQTIAAEESYRREGIVKVASHIANGGTPKLVAHVLQAGFHSYSHLKPPNTAALRKSA